MSHFSFLNLAIGLITFLTWGGLFYVREKSRLKSWFLNRFTRDKPPEIPPGSENSSQNLLPFPYDDFRPKNETTQKKQSDTENAEKQKETKSS